jgi:colanic acid biosynthesis glycosyl transferase WcaI
VRFLILGLNYPPESTSIGPYTADLAEYLVASGHTVRVVTGFPMAPQWRVWDGYRGKLFGRETINGVPVTRAALYVPREPRRPLNRILFDTSFCLSALLAGLASFRPDLIVAISPPLQLGLTSWILGAVMRRRFFIHLQDLVPDAAVATGMLRSESVLTRVARLIERVVYRGAAGIGVISQGFARSVSIRPGAKGKVKVLPNYIDVDSVAGSGRRFREAHGIAASHFVVMYSGSISLKQGLETLIDAAWQLRGELDMRFLIIGEGPSRRQLRERADRLRLTNTQFLPLQPRAGLADQLAAADALVITQRAEVADIVFPGKLLYYLAANRTLVASVREDGEVGEFVRSNQVGVVVPPENPVALAAALRRLSRERPRHYGERGREIAARLFDRRVVLREFSDHLVRLAREAGR